MKNPEQDGNPILITDAQRSYEEELATRKRRYGIMMGLRVPFLVMAAIFYQTPWLAATLIVMSIPLPWMAVIIANDRLPRKDSQFTRYRDDPGERPRLESGGEHRVIESPDGH